MNEQLRGSVSQVENLLRKAPVVRDLIKVLEARMAKTVRLGPPVDSLAEHEARARAGQTDSGVPAHYDRVQELKRQERKAHHDLWA